MQAGLKEHHLSQALCGMIQAFHTTAKAVPAGLLYLSFLIFASVFFHLCGKEV